MKMGQTIALAITVFAVLPVLANAQALAKPGDSTAAVASIAAAQPDLTYTRPTEKAKIQNYLFDAFGPYPAVGAAVAAGISQANNAPPEWKQGAEGYGKRFGSDFGIAATTTTTRYGLAKAFREDTLYYRCECKGVFPRLRHAVISTLSARRGEDGRRVFSLPALVAPYAGSIDCRLCVVSRPLQRRGRISDGQLHPAGICRRKHSSGILLQRTSLLGASHAPEQWARSARSGFQSVSDRKFSSGRSLRTSPAYATRLTYVPQSGLLQGADQRVFPMVRRPGDIFLASAAGGGDAAV